jgi:hypothetical protein
LAERFLAYGDKRDALEVNLSIPWFANTGQVIQTVAGVTSTWLAFLKAPLRSFSTTQKDIFVLQAVYLERSDEHPTTKYKRKLRIVLRNESGRDLFIRPANWQSKTGDIDTQPLPRGHPWQMEGGGGWKNGSWQPETENELPVRPGQVIQTWVGLLPSADEVEVSHHQLTKRLGTLVIPSKIDSCIQEILMRL